MVESESSIKMKAHKGFDNMLKRIAVVLLIGIIAFAYQITTPPPPNLCGSPGGPPVTGPRVTLRDGRHLAYNEYGVTRETANYKIVFVHGFSSCRFDESLFHQVVWLEYASCIYAWLDWLYTKLELIIVSPWMDWIA